jgi:hypothetical protein
MIVSTGNPMGPSKRVLAQMRGAYKQKFSSLPRINFFDRRRKGSTSYALSDD